MNSRFEIQETNELKMKELKTTESNRTQEMSQEAGRMLDNYLLHACRSDDAIVSMREQNELRAEMSDHIPALAAAHRELGSSSEEAMQAALKQFGEAEQIGQAVGYEIGKRPSLLGSPNTVSMIGGILSSWVVLGGTNYLLANTSIDVMSAEGHLLGLVLGCISGSVIWKRRKSIRQVALWNARFCAGMTALLIAVTFIYCCLFSGTAYKFISLEWLKLAAPVLLLWIIVTSIAGACSGALTSLWCRYLRKSLTNKQLQAV